MYSQFYQVAHLKSDKQLQDREELGNGASRWYMPDRRSSESKKGDDCQVQLPTLTQSRSVAGLIGQLDGHREVVVDPNEIRVRQLEEKRKAAQFRAMMQGQMVHSNGFSLNTDEEKLDEIREIVTNELMKTNLKGVEPDIEQHSALVDIIALNFPLLAQVFRYYSGFHDDGSSATLDFGEFLHFCEHCKMFDSHQSCYSHLIEVFLKVHFVSNPAIEDKRRLKEELTKRRAHVTHHVELRMPLFFEALMRLAVARAKVHSTPEKDVVVLEALEELLSKVVLPAMEARMTDDAIKGMAEPAVQLFLQDRMRKLQTVYKHYATLGQQRGSSTDKPTMSLIEYTEMLRDAGMVADSENGEDGRAHPPGDDGDADNGGGGGGGDHHGKKKHALKESAKAHPANDGKKSPPGVLLARDARVAFSMSQSDFGENEADGKGGDDEELTFPEFLETIARISSLKYDGMPMSFAEKIKLGATAIVDLSGSLIDR